MTWDSWAHEGDGRYVAFGTVRHLRFASPSRAAEPVTLIEDENGEYRGWLDTDADALTLVRPTHIFRIQSPDAFAGAVARGLGRIVKLSAVPRTL